MDPTAEFERWLGADEYTIRRQVVPTKGTKNIRAARTRDPFLVKLGFHDAHPWPLAWGGPEVKGGIFRAHGNVINQSFQRRVETAGARFAERLQPFGYRLFVTVAVTRFPELDLMERTTYKFEVVPPEGGLKILGEVTLGQNLSAAQRAELAARRKIPIDPRKISVIDPPEILTKKLGEFVEGLRTTRERGLPGARARAPKDRAETTGKGTGERKAAGRPGPGDRLSGPQDRHAGGGRPAKSSRSTEQGKSPRPAEPPSPRTKPPQLAPAGGRSRVGFRAKLGTVGAAFAELYGWQLESVHRQAWARAKAEFECRGYEFEIEARRAKGQWAAVSLDLDEPEMIDLLGMDPGQYPLYAGLSVNFGPTENAARNPSDSMRSPRPPTAVDRRCSKSLVAGRPPAKGRVRRTYQVVLPPRDAPPAPPAFPK